MVYGEDRMRQNSQWEAGFITAQQESQSKQSNLNSPWDPYLMGGFSSKLCHWHNFYSSHRLKGQFWQHILNKKWWKDQIYSMHFQSGLQESNIIDLLFLFLLSISAEAALFWLLITLSLHEIAHIYFIYNNFLSARSCWWGERNPTIRQWFCISYFLFSKPNVHLIDESKWHTRRGRAHASSVRAPIKILVETT